MRLTLLLALALPSATPALEPSVPGPADRPHERLDWRAFQMFGSADGLPQNSALALLQDRLGFVYAGTQDGVARYDGQRWTVIELPTGGRRYAVGALAEDEAGAIWVGTDRLGAWRLPPFGAADASPRKMGDLGNVHAFSPSADGRMWVATAEGVQRCGDAGCTLIEATRETGARSLLAERIDGEDRLWVGTNGAGVIQLADLAAAQPTRTAIAITRSDGLPNDIGLALARFAGDLWIGSGRGLARFNGQRLQVYGNGNGFPMAMVFALLPGRGDDGRPLLHVALRPGGLAEIEEDGRWRVLDSQHGLPANAVHSLLRERHRDLLWIGTMTAGVARMESSRWALFDERSGLPDRIVQGVGWSAAGGLWAGTAQGAVHWRNGRFVPLLPLDQPRLLVNDLVEIQGDRWIAHARGLQRWREATLIEAYGVENSALPAVAVGQLARRRNGVDGDELFIGSNHGLARWREGDGLQRVAVEPAVPHDLVVNDLATLPEPLDAGRDQLYVASSTHLLRLDTAGWATIDAPCLSNDGVLGIAPEARPDGARLWLATRHGLLRVGPGKVCETINAATPLGTFNHVQIVGAQVYAFGPRGALRLDRDSPADQPGRVLGAAAGLVSTEVTASAVDDEGRVFAASAAGLATLAPPVPRAARASAPLYLLSARAGESGRRLLAGEVLAADETSVAFEFALLAFERESEVRYRWQLVGLQSAFEPWSATRSAHFPRLPAGRYALRVEARDADGVDAVPIQFAFAVAAPWWQTPWAWLGAALLLLLTGLQLGRWRSRSLRRRADALAFEVAARTRELAAANAQLEEAAVTDPLTGLKNRRYFALVAPAEAQRALRSQASADLVFALLDIDHFKRINDSHGHDAGDAVLVEVARRLQRVARGGDSVLRWGGEEFLLLLIEVRRADVDALLRRVLQAIAATPITYAGGNIEVTASIGAVSFPFDPTAAPDTLIEQAISRADGALYQAKRGGRDRAVRWVASATGEAPLAFITLRNGD